MYRPHRDERFEYVTDAITFIEHRQCHDCVFRNERDDEFFMCGEYEARLFAEEPVMEIDDLGTQGLHCKTYKQDSEIYSQERLDTADETLL
jgi:hypothetical protein